jgi:hypothetical protein
MKIISRVTLSPIFYGTIWQHAVISSKKQKSTKHQIRSSATLNGRIAVKCALLRFCEGDTPKNLLRKNKSMTKNSMISKDFDLADA